MQMRREIFARIEQSYDQTVMDGFVLAAFGVKSSHRQIQKNQKPSATAGVRLKCRLRRRGLAHSAAARWSRPRSLRPRGGSCDRAAASRSGSWRGSGSTKRRKRRRHWSNPGPGWVSACSTATTTRDRARGGARTSTTTPRRARRSRRARRRRDGRGIDARRGSAQSPGTRTPRGGGPD